MEQEEKEELFHLEQAQVRENEEGHWKSVGVCYGAREDYEWHSSISCMSV